MSDKAEEILITVDVDAEPSVKRTQRLTAELKQLQAMKAALVKANKAGEVSEEAFAQAMEESEKQIKQTSASLKESQKVLELENKIRTSAVGSIDQMRAQLSLLTPQYTALSKIERETTEEGIALGRAIRQLSDDLKANESAIGDNRRNVGNYKDLVAELSTKLVGLRADLAAATDRYEKLGDAEKKTTVHGLALAAEINELTAAIKRNEAELVDAEKKTKKFGDALDDVENKLGSFGQVVGDLRGKFNSAKEGLNAMKLGLTGIKGAIAATGIGLLLLVLAAVAGALTRTQKGMDAVSRATASISAVFTVLINRGAKLAEALTQVFSDPIAAYRKFKEAFSGIGDEIAQVAAAASATEKASQQLREQERKLRVDRAMARAEIEKQKKISEDIFATEQQRLDAAKAAYAIESSLLGRQIGIQKQRIDILKQEAQFNGNRVEDLDKVADAEEELGNLQEESFGKQTELQNKLNEIRIQSIQNAAAKEIATQQEVLDVFMSQSEHIYSTESERADKILEIRKAMLDAQRQYDLAGVVEGSNQALAVEAKYNADLAKLKFDSLTEQLENENQMQLDGIAARASQEREGSVARLKIYEDELTAKLEYDELMARRTIKSQEQLDARLLALDNQYKADLKENAQKIRDEEFRIQDEIIQGKLAKVKEGSGAEFRLLLEQLAKRRKAILDNDRLTKEERDRQTADVDKEEDELREKRLATRAGQIVEASSQAATFASKLVEAGISRETRALDEQQKTVLENALLTADQRTAIEKDFAKKKELLELESAKKRKRIATVENIINTARAITAAYTTPVVGPILAALAAAVGAAQQVVIESQQFAFGGVPDGVDPRKRRRFRGIVKGPGTTTSDSIPAQLSRDESVMNARTTAKYYNELSAMNVDGGGVAFPGAQPVDLLEPVRGYMNQVRTAGMGISVPEPIYVTTAVVGRQAGSGSDGGIDTVLLADLVEAGVGRALERMPAPEVAVKEINRTNKRVKVIEAAADV